MRIVLVAIHPYPSPQAVPLGNAFLQTSLAMEPPLAGVDAVRVDFYIDTPLDASLDEIHAQRPDAVGFSTYVWNRTSCCRIATALREQFPQIRLFAGGPEATADPAGLLAGAPFDFLIIGEGELPFREFCRCLTEGIPPDALSGIATRTSAFSDAGTPVADLDLLPSPWLTGILDSRDYKGVLWQLSRGCGFSCDFCFDSRGVGGVRRFSLDRIEAELHHFSSSGVSQVFVLDSTFNQDMTRAKRILRLIRDIAPRIHFHFEVRSEFIDREMAHLFAEIFCSLQIGLQSADPAVMKNVGRNFDRKRFTAAADLLNDAGAVFGFDLMYGLPGDSLSGFRESIDYAIGLYPNHLDIFPLAVLPGTTLARRSHLLGLRHLEVPPYTLLSSPGYLPEELKIADRLTRACSIFYTRGKAVAWFNSLMAALKLSPSSFLEKFDHWTEGTPWAGLAETDLDDGTIWQMQREFLKSLFREERAEFLLPLVLDLVDYHHHYSAAASQPPPDTPGELQLSGLRVLELPCRRAPGVQLAVFTYEILEILESGEPVLRQFARRHLPTGSFAAIYPSPDGIATESLIEPYFRLLELSDGTTPCGRLAAALQVPEDEAESFLEFALAEGLLVPATSG